MTFHDLELAAIRSLHHMLRSSPLDFFFIAWNYVDSLPFTMAVISIVSFLIHRRIGIHLLYLMTLSHICNLSLKFFFLLPRPFQIDPEVGLLHLIYPGFPSGAAQTAAIVMGIVFQACKSKIAKGLSIVFAMTLCFSRIYLGVHFFSDILGGLIVGALLIYLYRKFAYRIDLKQKRVLLILPLLIYCLDPTRFLLQSGLLAGLGAGLLIQTREPPLNPWPIGCIEVVLAMLVVSLSVSIHTFASALFCGLWFSFLGPFVMNQRSLFSKINQGEI